MPLYVADYLADTGHLSTPEHGAYLLLIMHYWQNGGLPSEDAKLARICRMTAKEWSGCRDTLFDFFDSRWSHARIDRELCSAREAYERRAKAGQKGGKASAKGKPGPSNARSKAQARLEQSQSQSPLEPSREEEFAGGEGRTTPRRGAGQPSPAGWDDDAWDSQHLAEEGSR